MDRIVRTVTVSEMGYMLRRARAYARERRQSRRERALVEMGFERVAEQNPALRSAPPGWGGT